MNKIEETTIELNRALQDINPKWKVEIKEYEEGVFKKFSIRIFEGGKFIYAKVYTQAHISIHGNNEVIQEFITWYTENKNILGEEKIPTEIGAPGEDRYGIPPNSRNRGDKGWSSVNEYIENSKK